jgi:hypothetical protein
MRTVPSKIEAADESRRVYWPAAPAAASAAVNSRASSLATVIPPGKVVKFLKAK